MKKVLSAVSREQCLANPRILELGSGVGVIGLSLAKTAGQRSRLLCTDSNSACAEDFESNAESMLGVDAVSSGAASFRQLDMEEAAKLAEEWRADVVVADPP